MCLEIFHCANNTNQREHGVLFHSFSEAKKLWGREKVNPKWYPKVNKHGEKVVFWKFFWIGRMAASRSLGKFTVLKT